MTKRVQIVGHDSVGAATFTGRDRELSINTDTHEIRVHDGVTAGGIKVLTENQVNAKSILTGFGLTGGGDLSGNRTIALADNISLGNIATPNSQFVIRKDTAANAVAFVPLDGELWLETDTDTLYIGDGVTVKGKKLYSVGGSDVAIADGGTGASDAATARTNLSAQTLASTLTTLSTLTAAANKGIEFTGASSAALFDLTTAGKALLDDANAAAQRTTLGLGAAALLADPIPFANLTIPFTVGTAPLSIYQTGVSRTGGPNSLQSGLYLRFNNYVLWIGSLSRAVITLFGSGNEIQVFLPFNHANTTRIIGSYRFRTPAGTIRDGLIECAQSTNLAVTKNVSLVDADFTGGGAEIDMTVSVLFQTS